MLYWTKDEAGESLVFQLMQTKSSKSVLKFGVEQIMRLISGDISHGKVTFFLVDERLLPKPGEKLRKEILSQCINVFISEASVDSLKAMINYMNEHHRKKLK